MLDDQLSSTLDKGLSGGVEANDMHMIQEVFLVTKVDLEQCFLNDPLN